MKIIILIFNADLQYGDVTKRLPRWPVNVKKAVQNDLYLR